MRRFLLSAGLPLALAGGACAYLMVATANAADLSKACAAARRAEHNYSDNNATEAATRMTGWEYATQAEMNGGITPDDPDHVRKVVEDIMAFGAQITDKEEGKRTLSDFISDACP